MEVVAINSKSIAIPYSVENSFSLSGEHLRSFSIGDFLRLEKVIGSTEVSAYLSPRMLIEEIERIYIYENSQQITTFLLSNPKLIPILIEAPEFIYRVFGRVALYLELHHDPEEDWDELFIIIKTSCSPEKAVKFGEKLFDEWFTKVIDKVDGKLNYTEEPL